MDTKYLVYYLEDFAVLVYLGLFRTPVTNDIKLCFLITTGAHIGDFLDIRPDKWKSTIAFSCYLS